MLSKDEELILYTVLGILDENDPPSAKSGSEEIYNLEPIKRLISNLLKKLDNHQFLVYSDCESYPRCRLGGGKGA